MNGNSAPETQQKHFSPAFLHFPLLIDPHLSASLSWPSSLTCGISCYCRCVFLPFSSPAPINLSEMLLYSSSRFQTSRICIFRQSVCVCVHCGHACVWENEYLGVKQSFLCSNNYDRLNKILRTSAVQPFLVRGRRPVQHSRVHLTSASGAFFPKQLFGGILVNHRARVYLPLHAVTSKVQGCAVWHKPDLFSNQKPV